MSERLRQIVKTHLLRAGTNGITKLAAMANVSTSTVIRAENTGHVSERNGYRLALACGGSEEDALIISKECASKAKTA